MQKYVALLRGINVGGKARVEMSRLKAVFEDVGCADVLTYINSGNVVFSDPRKPKVLVNVLEAAIEKAFGFGVPIVLRTDSQIAEICNAIPTDWTNDDEQKTDVLFLWNEIDNPGILKQIAIDPELERVLFVAGALVWNVARENVTRGNGMKLVKSDFYQLMTVRNINTVRKLNELLR